MSLSLDQYHLDSLMLSQCNKHVITLSDQKCIVSVNSKRISFVSGFLSKKSLKVPLSTVQLKLYRGHIEKIDCYFLRHYFL